MCDACNAGREGAEEGSIIVMQYYHCTMIVCMFVYIDDARTCIHSRALLLLLAYHHLSGIIIV